jgi:serine/threonine-protein kinase
MPSVGSTEGCRVAFLVELLSRRYAPARERLRACPDGILEAAAFFIPVSLYEAMTWQSTGELGRARAAYEQARALLASRLEQDPRDPRLHAALGLALAGLDRPSEAIRHGRRAVELFPLSTDRLQAPVYAIDLALIHTMVGEERAAVEGLESVLSIPSTLSVAWLEADPRWDPLRDDPGFAALLERHR